MSKSKEQHLDRKADIMQIVQRIQREHTFAEYSTAQRLSDLIAIRFQIKVSPEEVEEFLNLTLDEEDLILTNKHANYAIRT